MKGILFGSMAMIALTALSGCAPYNWEQNYGTGQVNLTGPLSRNVTYVKGTTSFSRERVPASLARAASPGAVAEPAPVTVSPQLVQPVQQIRTVASPVVYGQPLEAAPVAVQMSATAVPIAVPVQRNLRQPQLGTFVPAASETSAFVPVSQSSFGRVETPFSANARMAPVSGLIREQFDAAPTGVAAASPLYAEVPGQSANLQTRRVGNTGLVVYSDDISDEVASNAASRSCSHEGKTADVGGVLSISAGIKQVNFTCI